MIPPGIEPGTLSVLDSRDNRYTTESTDRKVSQNQYLYSANVYTRASATSSYKMKQVTSCTEDISDLHSKLLRNDAYVCLPVTTPTGAGFVLVVATVNLLPSSPGPVTSISTI